MSEGPSKGNEHQHAGEILRGDRWCWLGFAAAALFCATIIMWLGRGLNFFYDEWGTILYRRQGGFSAFFAPHNGHLQAVVIVIYRLLFSLVGIRHYGVYRGVITTAHIACACLFFIYARRRLQPGIALLLTMPLLFLGAAWQVLFWPYMIGFVIPIGVFIAILLLRDRPRRFNDLAVAFLLALAMASSGLGVAVAIAVCLEMILRRDSLRRLWAVAVPSLLYLMWFFLYRLHAMSPASLRDIPGALPKGDLGFSELGTGISRANVHQLPGFLVSLAKAAVNGLIGVGKHENVIPLAFLVFGLVFVLVTRKSWNVRTVTLVACLGGFWVLVGVSRSHIELPEASRYIYPAGALILLVIVEVTRNVRLNSSVLLVGAVVAAIVTLGINTLSQEASASYLSFANNRFKLARVECNPASFSASFSPDPTFAPYITAGPYLAAVKDLGSPAGQRSCARR